MTNQQAKTKTRKPIQIRNVIVIAHQQIVLSAKSLYELEILQNQLRPIIDEKWS